VAVIRFAVLVVAFLAALLGPGGAGAARACSYLAGVSYHATRVSGPQPLNAGVLVSTIGFSNPGDAGPVSFQVYDDAGRAIAHEATPLRGYVSPEANYLIREMAPPVPGSKRIYGGLGFPIPALALEYGDEFDQTPPSLEGPIRMWVDRGHSSGGCFGGPFPGYVAEVQLPPANERAIVTIYATDRNGRDERPLRDVIAHPDRPSGARLAFSGELGRTVCLAFKTTDLAGNSTSLGSPCCADEKTASGPCERIAAPPRENFIPEPAPAGGGCSLSPRSQASAAWAWLAIVLGWLLCARRHRRLARPVRHRRGRAC
jgi:hypothetical protein